MLINVPICLWNLSQKSDSIAKCFGWALVDCHQAVIIQPLAWKDYAGAGFSDLVFSFCAHNRKLCSQPEANDGLSAQKKLKHQQSGYLWSPKPFCA